MKVRFSSFTIQQKDIQALKPACYLSTYRNNISSIIVLLQWKKVHAVCACITSPFVNRT